MKIDPYKQLDGIDLNTSSKQIIAEVGLLSTVRQNDIGFTEYDFGKYVFRFESSGNLSEVTADCPSVDLETQTVLFEELEAFVKRSDPQYFDKLGFLVSPRYGIAFDPDCSPWVTVLTSSGLRCWKNV